MLEHINETTAMDLVRLLLDEDRLRILGLVGREPCTEQMLAAVLAVKPNALMRHVRQLRQAGLVAVVVNDDQELYTLDVAAIQRAKRALFAPTADAPPVDDAAKTLAVFVHDGRIRHMPTHPDKLRVVLAWLAGQFEAGRDYTEAEVNDLLSRHHEDFALWRRYLVDEGWMTRQRGIYRKLDRS
jgi:hypothetical protein